MTTLVWCGRFLAADRRHQSGSVPHYDACKIERWGDAFYASTGPSAWMQAWIEWDTENSGYPADPHRGIPVNNLDGYQGGLVRLRDGVCDMLDFRLPYWTTSGAKFAWGSGADFALAAMACGKNAMEAVEIAAQFDTCTGGGVDFVDSHARDGGMGIRSWSGRDGPTIWVEAEPQGGYFPTGD